MSTLTPTWSRPTDDPGVMPQERMYSPCLLPHCRWAAWLLRNSFDNDVLSFPVFKHAGSRHGNIYPRYISNA